MHLQQYDENHCIYFTRIGRHSEQKKRYLLKWKQYTPCSRAHNKAVLPLRKTADHSGSYLYSHIHTAVYTVLDIMYYS